MSAKLESGKIIMQKKIKITVKDNIKSLTQKVLKEEHKLYRAAIIKIFT